MTFNKIKYKKILEATQRTRAAGKGFNIVFVIHNEGKYFFLSVYCLYLFFCLFFSCSDIVMITDGVVGVSETSMFDTLMAHLRHQTISCSFMQISSKFSLQNGFGFVPYPELLQFIATSTFGAYFAQRPTQVSTCINV